MGRWPKPPYKSIWALGRVDISWAHNHNSTFKLIFFTNDKYGNAFIDVCIMGRGVIQDLGSYSPYVYAYIPTRSYLSHFVDFMRLHHRDVALMLA